MTLTLLDLLSNTLVLSHISPHLPVSCLASLAASSKLFYSLVYDTPYVFRRLDLSTVKAAGTLFDQIDTGGVKWRNQQMDEAITEEDFYSGPLRGIFGKLKRKNVLQDVRTLILDGLSVPAELVHEIIADDPFNVEILSIRGAKNINEGKLAQTLLYAARPSRPPNTPRLKGFYFFGSDPRPQAPATDSQVEPSQTSSTASMDSVTTGLGAQIGTQWNHKSSLALSSSAWSWYRPSGPMCGRAVTIVWGAVIRECEGVIAFDVPLCRGPRHDPTATAAIAKSTAEHNVHHYDALANIALGPTGCARCHSSPEGPAPPSYLPLLAPPPLHSTNVNEARKPPNSLPLYARCKGCLEERWCERCKTWWCEECYTTPAQQRLNLMPVTDQLAEVDGRGTIKVHLGLCVQRCLVEDMMVGAGGGGMWG